MRDPPNQSQLNDHQIQEQPFEDDVLMEDQSAFYDDVQINSSSKIHSKNAKHQKSHQKENYTSNFVIGHRTTMNEYANQGRIHFNQQPGRDPVQMFNFPETLKIKIGGLDVQHCHTVRTVDVSELSKDQKKILHGAVKNVNSRLAYNKAIIQNAGMRIEVDESLLQPMYNILVRHPPGEPLIIKQPESMNALTDMMNFVESNLMKGNTDLKSPNDLFNFKMKTYRSDDTSWDDHHKLSFILPQGFGHVSGLGNLSVNKQKIKETTSKLLEIITKKFGSGTTENLKRSGLFDIKGSKGIRTLYYVELWRILCGIQKELSRQSEGVLDQYKRLKAIKQALLNRLCTSNGNLSNFPGAWGHVVFMTLGNWLLEEDCVWCQNCSFPTKILSNTISCNCQFQGDGVKCKMMLPSEDTCLWCVYKVDPSSNNANSLLLHYIHFHKIEWESFKSGLNDMAKDKFNAQEAIIRRRCLQNPYELQNIIYQGDGVAAADIESVFKENNLSYALTSMLTRLPLIKQELFTFSNSNIQYIANGGEQEQSLLAFKIKSLGGSSKNSKQLQQIIRNSQDGKKFAPKLKLILCDIERDEPILVLMFNGCLGKSIQALLDMQQQEIHSYVQVVIKQLISQVNNLQDDIPYSWDWELVFVDNQSNISILDAQYCQVDEKSQCRPEHYTGSSSIWQLLQVIQGGRSVYIVRGHVCQLIFLYFIQAAALLTPIQSLGVASLWNIENMWVDGFIFSIQWGCKAYQDKLVSDWIRGCMISASASQTGQIIFGKFDYEKFQIAFDSYGFKFVNEPQSPAYFVAHPTIKNQMLNTWQANRNARFFLGAEHMAHSKDPAKYEHPKISLFSFMSKTNLMIPFMSFSKLFESLTGLSMCKEPEKANFRTDIKQYEYYGLDRRMMQIFFFVVLSPVIQEELRVLNGSKSQDWLQYNRLWHDQVILYIGSIVTVNWENVDFLLNGEAKTPCKELDILKDVYGSDFLDALPTISRVIAFSAFFEDHFRILVQKYLVTLQLTKGESLGLCQQLTSKQLGKALAKGLERGCQVAQSIFSGADYVWDIKSLFKDHPAGARVPMSSNLSHRELVGNMKFLTSVKLDYADQRQTLIEKAVLSLNRKLDKLDLKKLIQELGQNVKSIDDCELEWQLDQLGKSENAQVGDTIADLEIDAKIDACLSHERMKDSPFTDECGKIETDEERKVVLNKLWQTLSYFHCKSQRQTPQHLQYEWQLSDTEVSVDETFKSKINKMFLEPLKYGRNSIKSVSDKYIVGITKNSPMWRYIEHDPVNNKTENDEFAPVFHSQVQAALSRMFKPLGIQSPKYQGKDWNYFEQMTFEKAKWIRDNIFDSRSCRTYIPFWDFNGEQYQKLQKKFREVKEYLESQDIDTRLKSNPNWTLFDSFGTTRKDKITYYKGGGFRFKSNFEHNHYDIYRSGWSHKTDIGYFDATDLQLHLHLILLGHVTNSIKRQPPTAQANKIMNDIFIGTILNPAWYFLCYEMDSLTNENEDLIKEAMQRQYAMKHFSQFRTSYPLFLFSRRDGHARNIDCLDPLSIISRFQATIDDYSGAKETTPDEIKRQSLNEGEQMNIMGADDDMIWYKDINRDHCSDNYQWFNSLHHAIWKVNRSQMALSRLMGECLFSDDSGEQQGRSDFVSRLFDNCSHFVEIARFLLFWHQQKPGVQTNEFQKYIIPQRGGPVKQILRILCCSMDIIVLPFLMDQKQYQEIMNHDFGDKNREFPFCKADEFFSNQYFEGKGEDIKNFHQFQLEMHYPIMQVIISEVELIPCNLFSFVTKKGEAARYGLGIKMAHHFLKHYKFDKLNQIFKTQKLDVDAAAMLAAAPIPISFSAYYSIVVACQNLVKVQIALSKEVSKSTNWSADRVYLLLLASESMSRLSNLEDSRNPDYEEVVQEIPQCMEKKAILPLVISMHRHTPRATGNLLPHSPLLQYFLPTPNPEKKFLSQFQDCLKAFKLYGDFQELDRYMSVLYSIKKSSVIQKRENFYMQDGPDFIKNGANQCSVKFSENVKKKAEGQNIEIQVDKAKTDDKQKQEIEVDLEEQCCEVSMEAMKQVIEDVKKEGLFDSDKVRVDKEDRDVERAESNDQPKKVKEEEVQESSLVQNEPEKKKIVQPVKAQAENKAVSKSKKVSQVKRGSKAIKQPRSLSQSAFNEKNKPSPSPMLKAMDDCAKGKDLKQIIQELKNQGKPSQESQKQSKQEKVKEEKNDFLLRSSSLSDDVVSSERSEKSLNSSKRSSSDEGADEKVKARNKSSSDSESDGPGRKSSNKTKIEIQALRNESKKIKKEPPKKAQKPTKKKGQKKKEADHEKAYKYNSKKKKR